MVDCPCCKNRINKLKSWMGSKWKCVRGHIFALERAPEGGRALVVEAAPDGCCKKGERYRVSDDAEFVPSSGATGSAKE